MRPRLRCLDRDLNIRIAVIVASGGHGIIESYVVVISADGHIDAVRLKNVAVYHLHGTGAVLCDSRTRHPVSGGTHGHRLPRLYAKGREEAGPKARD